MFTAAGTGKGYLEILSEKIVTSMSIPSNMQEIKLLKVITEPVSHFVIKVKSNSLVSLIT